MDIIGGLAALAVAVVWVAVSTTVKVVRIVFLEDTHS